MQFYPSPSRVVPRSPVNRVSFWRLHANEVKNNLGDVIVEAEGDKRLFNQYGVMLANPAKYPSVKKDLGQQFIDCLISPEGQNAIASDRINGQQFFYPDGNDLNA
jgi:tungstate transport system substrate-binding protein